MLTGRMGEGAEIMAEDPETAAVRQDPAGVPDPGREPGIALVEQRLGHALGQQQRVAVAGVLGWLADAWASHRTAVPDGTEPDFVFRPTPLLTPGDRPVLAEEDARA